jgi:hypothetical protein
MGGQFGGIRASRSALLLMGAAMVLALGVSSCAKPPQVEMDAAKAAIEKAKQMEASEYAASDLRAATDSLAAADAEVTTQQGKFALFRSYKKAKALYVSAQQLGATAEQNAIKNKEQARKDAQTALDEARATIANMRTLMASKEAQALKRGKETREALKQIEAELGATDSSLVNVTAAQHAEKYKQAISLAKAANQKAAGLMNELQTAIENKKAIGGMKK